MILTSNHDVPHYRLNFRHCAEIKVYHYWATQRCSQPRLSPNGILSMFTRPQSAGDDLAVLVRPELADPVRNALDAMTV
jgi:hypothetical protein